MSERQTPMADETPEYGVIQHVSEHTGTLYCYDADPDKDA